MHWETLVGANIRRLRKERNLTQEQLALSASVDLRYFGGIERGEHSPTIGVVGRIAATLGVHPSLLFNEASGENG